MSFDVARPRFRLPRRARDGPAQGVAIALVRRMALATTLTGAVSDSASVPRNHIHPLAGRRCRRRPTTANQTHRAAPRGAHSSCEVSDSPASRSGLISISPEHQLQRHLGAPRQPVQSAGLPQASAGACRWGVGGMESDVWCMVCALGLRAAGGGCGDVWMRCEGLIRTGEGRCCAGLSGLAACGE